MGDGVDAAGFRPGVVLSTHGAEGAYAACRCLALLGSGAPTCTYTPPYALSHARREGLNAGSRLMLKPPGEGGGEGSAANRAHRARAPAW